MISLPSSAIEEDILQQQIGALGPWFHNLRLNGIQTAPDHFLGDYPELKFAAFRHALPADLSGLLARDEAPRRSSRAGY